MTKYLHVLLACAAEPWAMEKSKLVSVVNFLRVKALGGKIPVQEVAAIAQQRPNAPREEKGNISVLPIQGVIGERMNLLDDISGGTSTEQIARQFRGMLNDDRVKAIVLDINSPGGVARSVQELGEEIFNARGIKPIVAQIDTCAASAAYWIATQADEVVVTPSGQAGSIGVYTIHEDISKMLEMEGITETLIYSSRNKVLGNSLEPLGEDARDVIQQRVDELAVSFVNAVARGRGVTPEQVESQFGQGLMFNAAELVARGMVDRVSTMAETLESFGIQVNPALSRHLGRGEAAQKMLSRLSAGDRLTTRELENGLKGLGLTNSEAERAVRVLLGTAQGEPENTVTDQTAVDAALAELRQRLDGFSIPT